MRFPWGRSLRFGLALRHRASVYFEEKQQRQEGEDHHAEEEEELLVRAYGGFARHDRVQVAERRRLRGGLREPRRERLQDGEPLRGERARDSQVRREPGAGDHLAPEEHRREEREAHGAPGL